MKTIHMGDVQNSLVRFILWKIGDAPVSDSSLRAAREYFGQKCAYCCEATATEFDHAVPINKASLGQHCIGNLIPSCRECNGPARKGQLDFRVYLKRCQDGDFKIAKILKYMASHNYIPLDKDHQIKELVEAARQEVSEIATRYIGSINALLRDVVSPITVEPPLRIDGTTKTTNLPPRGMLSIEQIESIKKRMNRSWSNLRNGCLDHMGISVNHGTPRVGGSSRTFAKNAAETTGLSYPEIIALLDQHKLGLEPNR